MYERWRGTKVLLPVSLGRRASVDSGVVVDESAVLTLLFGIDFLHRHPSRTDLLPAMLQKRFGEAACQCPSPVFTPKQTRPATAASVATSSRWPAAVRWAIRTASGPAQEPAQ